MSSFGSTTSGNLFHAELHQGSEEDAKVDLEGYNDDVVFNVFDMGEILCCENLEDAVASGGGDEDAEEEEAADNPVLACVGGKGARVLCAGVDIDYA